MAEQSSVNCISRPESAERICKKEKKKKDFRRALSSSRKDIVRACICRD